MSSSSNPAKAPKPGTQEARAGGCICPVMDNSYGKGRYGDGEAYGWYITACCPLHDPGVPQHQEAP